MSRESISRRAVIGVAALALLGVGVVLLLPRFSAQPDQANTSANNTVNATGEDGGIPPASEDLIAAALAAGDITYEQSLLERAYAWFDDPRLQPNFRSEIVDWEAGGRLLDEVHRKEATLSKAMLTELAPFRARPADPISIFNRPQAEVVRAQYTPGASDWVSLLVPGAGDWTPLRVWIKGTEADLKPHMADTTRMWASYHKFFVDGWEDAGASTQTYNPDTAVDLYLVRAGETDPRCRTLPCAAASRSMGGWSPIAEPDNGRQCSGYAVVNIDMRRDEIIGTMAHELTHVAQRQYECSDNLMFLTDGSATWVGYKVLKDLGIVPDYGYDYLKNPDRWSTFPNLHRRLDHPLNAYASWPFFYYASMEFGDGIVKTIWAGHSVGPGPGGPGATNSGLGTVNKAVPLDEHFPKFALRNWNQEPVPDQYVDEDGTFPSTLKPEPRIPMPAGIGKAELDQPVARVSTRYYHYTSFDAAVRRVTIQNLYTDLPYAHLWAIKKIGTQWKPPEDWSRVPQSVLCRDFPTDDVSELVLIVSNSHLVEALPPGHPRPRVLSEDVGCEAVKGTAKATLRLKDPERNMDISYVSSSAQLRFRPRTVQDQPGNVQYRPAPDFGDLDGGGKNGRLYRRRADGRHHSRIRRSAARSHASRLRVSERRREGWWRFSQRSGLCHQSGRVHHQDVSRRSAGRDPGTVPGCVASERSLAAEYAYRQCSHVQGDAELRSCTHSEQHANEPGQRANGPSQFSCPWLHHARDTAAVEGGAGGIGAGRCRERRQNGLHVRVGAAAMRTILTMGALLAVGAGLIAQSQLAQLGLTETAARSSVLNEIKGPAADRGAPIEVAGTRAFLKLPPAARGPAATALFAWAKLYVSSPGFTASYNTYRNGRLPTERQYALSVDAQAKKEIAEQLAGFEQMRLAAEKMPPKDRDMMMEQVKQALANLTNPAYADKLRAQLTAERAQERGQASESAVEVEATTPADPQKLFARRLREFLNATADVNFSARTISLTGGPDGIEFIDKADRAKPWMWQAAAIVGREATVAARAAAEVWLKEIER